MQSLLRFLASAYANFQTSASALQDGFFRFRQISNSHFLFQSPKYSRFEPFLATHLSNQFTIFSVLFPLAQKLVSLVVHVELTPPPRPWMKTTSHFGGWLVRYGGCTRNTPSSYFAALGSSWSKPGYVSTFWFRNRVYQVSDICGKVLKSSKI